jgi:glycosyltransferase involved in cell wall biosynthesis
VGYEVTIVSVGQARDAPFFGDLPPSVEIVTLDDKRPSKEPGWTHPIKRALRERSSVLMHPEDQSFKGFNLWADWRMVKTLRGRAGLLITTRPGLNLLAAELAIPGLAIVGQEHMHLREHSETLQKAMKRRYRKLAVLAVLTERDRKRYAKHLGKRTPVVRIPNTVRDLGDVSADLSSKTVLAAGRLAFQKGYDRLIRAWSLVSPEHPDWQLVIHGNGPAQARLERLIAENGLEDTVTLAGPAADLGAEMAKASIFALSSRWEGLPLVLLEAMSVGMAVVSFNCPTGPADVVEDHVNGLLIRPKTIANFAAGLKEMIESEELRRSCAAAAVETARLYSMELVGPQWESVLQEAWEKHAAA